MRLKENRTYDQLLGDLPQGDGDASLLFYSRETTPNHHALVERFGLYDRFFTNAEVSSQGHPWSMSAYVTDYLEKVTPSIYSHRRPERDEGEVEDPPSGYLWDAAARRGISLRIYGEYAEPAKGGGHYESTKPGARPFTSPDYPSFDMDIPDQVRADVWLRDFQGDVADGRMPALQILHLPCDHTAGARPGKRTPRAFTADNDLALGRIVEAVSKSPFWKSTALFVVEDDAQAGPDHVDSHRSVFLAISPYLHAGVVHRFVNTTDVLATVEEILGLEALSQYDHYGRTLRGLFGREPDLRPYQAVVPGTSLTEVNPPKGPGAEASSALDLSTPDASDDALFNQILWAAIKGDQVPFPGPRRASLQEIVQPR